jgi:hypothetical protein
MTALDRVIPFPRLVEIDGVELAAPATRVWEIVRHGELAGSPLVRALFALRDLPARLSGKPVEPMRLRLDEMRSSPAQPGFQILSDDPPREVVIGAIGKVWHLDIPFLHAGDASAYAAYDGAGWIKVAWALRVVPLGDRGSRLELEVRVDATDDESWHKFRTYFRIIGPGSHFVRRSLLSALARELGTPEKAEALHSMPGDALLPDAGAQMTDGITIHATPAVIWPWLLQMGCRRAGFYSIDLLDNGGARSAREIHPELQHVGVGQLIPATPEGDDGFEVLALEPQHTLVLGGLYDAAEGRQLPFHVTRPERYWQVTWAFALEQLDAQTTRLHVRGRAAYPPSGRLHATWIRPVHHLMQRAQLRHLAARAEGRESADDWRDVLSGIGGAALMAINLLAPFARHARCTWGLSGAEVDRVHPGDELVPEPRWGWTHGVEIEAPAFDVWPWVAQIGADRAGFYSYQWLENLAGCALRNAEVIHPEWQLHAGGTLQIHPKIPPLAVVHFEPGRCFVAHAAADEAARAAGQPWVACSWLFLVEPLGDQRCRLVSRFRASSSDDLATRLSSGPTLIEPIGFVMDRRMLLGIKRRAEPPPPR